MIHAKYKEGRLKDSTAQSWPGYRTNRGALLGLLAGAACGLAAMPPGLVAGLAAFDEFEAEIDGFVALCCAANGSKKNCVQCFECGKLRCCCRTIGLLSVLCCGARQGSRPEIPRTFHALGDASGLPLRRWLLSVLSMLTPSKPLYNYTGGVATSG
jgi:hypothetical protein